MQEPVQKRDCRCKVDLSGLQTILDYKFIDESLLRNALTHSSFASEHGLCYGENNERLEFIGDAYLDAVIGAKLYEIMGDAHEGQLSRNRAEVVCEESLAEIARSVGLGTYLFLGHGEEISGGRDKKSILADALEAVLGAIICDGGFEAGRQVALTLFESTVEDAVSGKLNKDYKSQLQEILQEKYHDRKIIYEVVSESGPDHDKLFTVNVLLDRNVLGTGIGKSKSKAEQAAACAAISKGALQCISKE